jgi:hypothetical protein
MDWIFTRIRDRAIVPTASSPSLLEEHVGVGFEADIEAIRLHGTTGGVTYVK